MKPLLQALVIADKVYEDKATGKKVIAGTFNMISFKKGPPPEKTGDGGGQTVRELPGGMVAGSPSAYISLTDLNGDCELILRYVDLDDEQVMFQAKLNVTCSDPLRTIEIVAPLPVLPIPHPGVYAFEVLCDDEPLGSHRIIAREITPEG